MKHAVIIGGTRGIGAGIATSLMDKGWRVTATGVAEDEVAAFLDTHPDANADVLDVRDMARVKTFFDAQSTLDGLVNCAGILSRGEEYQIDVFERVIDINLTGTMRTCVAAHDLLADGGGAIVNTASMLSFLAARLCPPIPPQKVGLRNSPKRLPGAGPRMAFASMRWRPDGLRRK